MEENPNLDRLFLLHTYLSAVVGLALQRAFGVDIRGEAAKDPVGLLGGCLLEQTTGIRGVVESDFFSWPPPWGSNGTPPLGNKVPEISPDLLGDPPPPGLPNRQFPGQTSPWSGSVKVPPARGA